ncbi:hypothetical protein ACH5RR_021442 [Cinchona calisaya]|uniref:Uncharacterized protein n=1 Tax=Cinchona calisaya TaxID=153742 RepID=A0ABD2ZM98_9GENT
MSWEKNLLSHEYQVSKKASSTRLLVDEPMGKFNYLADRFCRQNLVCETGFLPKPPHINMRYIDRIVEGILKGFTSKNGHIYLFLSNQKFRSYDVFIQKHLMSPLIRKERTT